MLCNECYSDDFEIIGFKGTLSFIAMCRKCGNVQNEILDDSFQHALDGCDPDNPCVSDSTVCGSYGTDCKRAKDGNQR